LKLAGKSCGTRIRFAPAEHCLELIFRENSEWKQTPVAMNAAESCSHRVTAIA
jgi:hypothetical protein